MSPSSFPFKGLSQLDVAETGLNRSQYLSVSIYCSQRNSSLSDDLAKERLFQLAKLVKLVSVLHE